MATGRLPYDALFLFDRYIQVVTAAIRDNSGHVTSIAGDGVMSMFGINSNGTRAARDAFEAAAQGPLPGVRKRARRSPPRCRPE